MILKTAILVDPMGHGFGDYSPEMEAANHLKTYKELLKPAELKAIRVWTPGSIEPGTDLLIYDFGGMMPGTDLMDSNAHSAVQWAKDNPNSLLVVVSRFTYDQYIKYELEELGLDLFNVIVDDGKEDPIPQWFRAAHGLGRPDLDKVSDARFSIEVVELLTEFAELGLEVTPKRADIHEMIDEHGHEQEPLEEAEEIREVQALADDDEAVGFITTEEDLEPKPERDWNLEAPKEPVAFITVPVYCDWYPGVAKGKMSFKFADCMVDITEGEHQIAHMGGAFGGVYEISFPDGKGSLWGYHIKPKDFWEQFEKMHANIKDELNPDNKDLV